MKTRMNSTKISKTSGKQSTKKVAKQSVESSVKQPVKVSAKSDKSDSNVIRIEDNSRNTVISAEANLKKTIFLSNTNSRNIRLNCGSNSNVTCIELNNSQNENEIKREITLSKNAVLNFYSLYVGSKNQRSNMVAELNENSELNVKNIFLSDKQEHSHELKVIHKQRGSKSRLESRGILSDSKMNIKGLIRIEEEAEESEGYQKSDILILNNSEAISIPELEIKNNNVKCSHGSSITRLDKEKIFYLQTRGLNETKSKEVLINAFLSSMLEALEEEEKEKLNTLIGEKLALIVK